jgi:hypothetical protein
MILTKILVITPCYGHAWAFSRILKAEGYVTYGIIIGNIELEAEDIEDNLFSIQPLDEVLDKINWINPEIIIIGLTLGQRYDGLDIANRAKGYKFFTLSSGNLVDFPPKQACLFEPSDYSDAGKNIWLRQLEQILE